MKDRRQLDKLINEALAIEAEEAREAGKLGFMARGLVQATMPHKKTLETYHERVNGNYRLVMTAADPQTGLPYGSIPRLMLAWIATEAIRTKERELKLGDSLSDFMRQLDMVPTGGRWGSITRLKDQSRRLFGALIQCSYSTKERDAAERFLIVEKQDLWWSTKQPGQTGLMNSYVVLSERFHEEIINNPVPIDMRALNALKKSPLALDIYCWLTYRMSYLKRPTSIPWEALQAQFGSSYAMTAQGKADFKRAFNRQMKKISLVYANANIELEPGKVILKPSKTHVLPKR
jgi:hypothetical protein